MHAAIATTTTYYKIEVFIKCCTYEYVCMYSLLYAYVRVHSLRNGERKKESKSGSSSGDHKLAGLAHPDERDCGAAAAARKLRDNECLLTRTTT